MFVSNVYTFNSYSYISNIQLYVQTWFYSETVCTSWRKTRRLDLYFKTCKVTCMIVSWLFTVLFSRVEEKGVVKLEKRCVLNIILHIISLKGSYIDHICKFSVLGTAFQKRLSHRNITDRIKAWEAIPRDEEYSSQQ